MKSELTFSVSGITNGKEKEKDSRTFVVGVETGAEREFVISTVRTASWA